MKKIVILFLILLLCGCQNTEDLKKGESSNVLVEDNLPTYIDENPVKISLYVDNAAGGLDIAGEEFRDTWRQKRDIVILSSIFSEEEVIKSDYFQNIWKNAAEKYKNYQDYKTQWYISFKLVDGTEIKQIVKHPDDVAYFYDYLEVYMYDSVNPEIGTWYTHLTGDDMNENTIMTTMKLTAGSRYEEIEGEITVKVYTYDSLDDFDESGNYRGNSMSAIKVYND